MKILNASVQLIDKPEVVDRMSVLQYLEKIGRVCYKSEDRITDDSCVKFIKMLRDRKHWAILEHFIFTFDVPKDLFDQLNQVMIEVNDYRVQNFAQYFNKSICVDRYKVQHFARYFNKSIYVDKNDVTHYLVSASATAINNMINIPGLCIDAFMAIAKRLWVVIPEIILLPEDSEAMMLLKTTDESDVVILQPRDIEKLPRNMRMQHDWFTAFYITNRAIANEVIRHRPFSYAQESTRYVKYGDITIIKPMFDVNTLSNETELQKYNLWRHAMETTEQTYSKLLDLGAKPQEARGVLPNDLKTELNQTGRLESWVHFFKMRCSDAAHPQMREVAEQLYDQAAKYAPGVFPGIARE